MTLGDSIRKNTLWIITGKFFDRILGFVIGVVLARLLFPADFGMIVTIQIFTGVAGYFAGGGMGEALVRAKYLKDNDFKVVFTLQLIICSLLYLLFFSIAPRFALWFGDPLYTDLMRVSTLNFLIRPFVRIPGSILKREMRFKQIAFVGFISSSSGGAASVILALRDMGPWSLVVGGLVGTLTNVIGFYYITRWKPGIVFEAEAAKRLGSYGFKTSINAIIEYLRTQTSNLIISRMLGPAPLGLYNKAESLAGLPMQMVGGNAYPTVFRALSKIQDNLDQSKYVYYRTITLVMVYTLPFYVGLFWVAEPFILTVYGSKWQQTVIPLQIFTLTGLFRCITNPSGAVIAAQNRLGHEIRIQLEVWAILIAGCVIGIQWGIIGVAWGILPSFIYRTVRLSWLANCCIGGRYYELLKALSPGLLLNGVLASSCWLTDIGLVKLSIDVQSPSYMLIMATVGAVVYLLSFLFLPIASLQSEVKRWKKVLYRYKDVSLTKG